MSPTSGLASSFLHSQLSNVCYFSQCCTLKPYVGFNFTGFGFNLLFVVSFSILPPLKHILSVQKKDMVMRATYRGKSRKRSLPESTDNEPTSLKKFGFEVQQSTTRISEFGGSLTAVWVTTVSQFSEM